MRLPPGGGKCENHIFMPSRSTIRKARSMPLPPNSKCNEYAGFRYWSQSLDPGRRAKSEQIGTMLPQGLGKESGISLIECVIALTVIGLLSALMSPKIAGLRDRLAVRQAIEATAAFYESARMGTLLRSSRIRIEFRSDSLLAWDETSGDSLYLRRPGPISDGVTLTTTHPVIRILPTGLGAGGSNTTLIFRRGEFADSITTSRLGRLKR